MEIKKADSKGRVTGFEPGVYYSILQEGDVIKLNPLNPGGYIRKQGELQGMVHSGERVEPLNDFLNRVVPGWSDRG